MGRDPPSSASPIATTPMTAGEAGADVFGHPRGLAILFGAEMWERFSYYGMRALLVLYMVKYLLVTEPSAVFGFTVLKSGLEAVFGPLGVQPLSSQIYGLYSAFVYLTPIFGGLLADRVLGQRRTVMLGAALMAVGHFMMAVERLFFVALITLIIANGLFKPNISSQVGRLYAPGDARRDRAYSIFYVGINLGAFLAPLVCGSLGERVGWHYGFAAAGFGMLIGLVIYAAGQRHLPPDALAVRRAGASRETLTRAQGRRIAALLFLFVPVTFFWATYEQQGNTTALWIDLYTDRHIDLVLWRGEIPTTWFQAFNPFMIFAFTPFVLALWRRQAARGREPSTVMKMAFGCFCVALANLLMAILAQRVGVGKASWLWLAVYFAIITLGELYISPIGLSLVSKVAPASLLSMLMGVWLATSFTGNFIAGWLGSFWSAMDKPLFFLMIAGVAGAAALVIALADRPLRPMLEADDAQDAATLAQK